MTSLLSGYIDRAGDIVIAPALADAQPFHGALAMARPFGSWDLGIIGLDGRWVVAPTIAAYNVWSEGVTGFNVGGAFDDTGDVVGGRWGIAGDGRVIVAPSLEDVGGCGQGLIAIKRGGRWGYLDTQGRDAIAPRFDDADAFQPDGLAVVTADGHDGYLDRHGDWRLPARFEALAPTSDGRGRARISGRWHVIDLDGTVLSEGFDEILPFSGGMARVTRGGQLGYVGLDGARLGDAWFDEAGPYADGLAPVQRGDEWFFLDARGAMHGPYQRALPPTGGLARFVEPSGAVGFLAADGSVPIAALYDAAFGFHDGLAAVMRDALWTFVDQAGVELHAPYWHRAGNFHEGLCTVRYGTRAGVIDKTGAVVVAPAYDVIEPFSSGRAAVTQIQWRAVGPLPSSWHVTPREGLAFRGFAGAGDADELRVAVGFREPVVDDDALRVAQLVDMWRVVATAHAGGDPVRDVHQGDHALTLRVGDLAYPAELLQVLLAELHATGVPIMDVALARFRPATASGPQLAAWPHPDDPRGPTMFDTFELYATAAFDGTPPPASESRQHLLAGRKAPGTPRVVLAERTFTLHLPDIRICYGVQQDGFVAGDARADEVGQGIADALARRFDRDVVWFSPLDPDPGPPRPFTRDNQAGVEVIEADLGGVRRRGYCFAIDTVTCLHDLGPSHYRYREYELMEGVAAAVRALALRPLILWQRFGTPLPGTAPAGSAQPVDPTVYVFNLWEP